MPAPSVGKTEDTVGIRELYNLILEQNNARHEMERRIVEKLDTVAACTQTLEERVTHNTNEINALRASAEKRSDRNDVITGVVTTGINVFMSWVIGNRL